MIFSVLISLLFFISSLILLGFLFERISRFAIESKVYKGKKFVEIHGKKLHYLKNGEGKYTVVFQSGIGSSHAIWTEIQNRVSSHATTISYDRNGIMLSDSTGLPTTNIKIAEELEELLEKTNCPKPYILVGHSMAAIYLRIFIQRNISDVAGIVFVEPAHPLQIQRYSPQILKALRVPPYWLASLSINSGLYRLLFSFFPLSPEIPMNHWLHNIEKQLFYKSYKKTFDELKNDRLNMHDVLQYGNFGNIPFTIITGTSEIRYSKIKSTVIHNEYRIVNEALQRDLLHLSTRSRQVLAPNSGHLVQINDGDIIVSEVVAMVSLN